LFNFSDQYRLSAFTSLSIVVGRMVRAVHRCLLTVLSSESSAVVITQVLKCLAMVIANVPYQRLRPGLLGSAVKQIRPYLSHRGKFILFYMKTVLFCRTYETLPQRRRDSLGCKDCCANTNLPSLEFTACSSARSSCWLRTI